MIILTQIKKSNSKGGINMNKGFTIEGKKQVKTFCKVMANCFTEKGDKGNFGVIKFVPESFNFSVNIMGYTEDSAIKVNFPVEKITRFYMDTEATFCVNRNLFLQSLKHLKNQESLSVSINEEGKISLNSMILPIEATSTKEFYVREFEEAKNSFVRESPVFNYLGITNSEEFLSLVEKTVNTTSERRDYRIVLRCLKFEKEINKEQKREYTRITGTSGITLSSLILNDVFTENFLIHKECLKRMAKNKEFLKIGSLALYKKEGDAKGTGENIMGIFTGKDIQISFVDNISGINYPNYRITFEGKKTCESVINMDKPLLLKYANMVTKKDLLHFCFEPDKITVFSGKNQIGIEKNYNINYGNYVITLDPVSLKNILNTVDMKNVVMEFSTKEPTDYKEKYKTLNVNGRGYKQILNYIYLSTLSGDKEEIRIIVPIMIKEAIVF